MLLEQALSLWHELSARQVQSTVWIHPVVGCLNQTCVSVQVAAAAKNKLAGAPAMG